MKPTFRIERDSMGEMQVPTNSLYGAQTARAVENFPVSGWRFSREFIQALGWIKEAAAMTNARLKEIPRWKASAISRAAREVSEGRWDGQFVVDVFQTGSGTSTHMNINEVIAHRAKKLCGRPIHPNDDVNHGQSSNDVIPSAIHVAAWTQIRTALIPSLNELHRELRKKESAFRSIHKIGRTHLQDATPITLGQEFSGYAAQVAHGIERARSLEESLTELALGGTAVGTGLNTHRDFARQAIALISRRAGVRFREAANHFEAQAAQDAVVEASGVLKSIAVSLIKIADDIRWLASGPRLGLGEIELPATQPGSSIMPGKVNPVMCEMLLQVSAQVIGHDSAITLGGTLGQFELNTMLPLMAYDLLASIQLLARGSALFAQKCVRGIRANRRRCEGEVEQSLSLATHLVPQIGYDRAAAIAKKAHATGKTIRETAIREGLPPQKVKALLRTKI